MTNRLIYLLLAIVFWSCVGSNPTKSVQQNGKGMLHFIEPSYNFGEIHHGEIVGHRFLVVNKGHSPVVIQKIEHGCGCTDAVYTKEPIEPSDTAFVEVIFDTNGWTGRQVKQVVILANDSIQKHDLLIWASIK